MSATDPKSGTAPPAASAGDASLVKLLIEVGPLVVFFIANARYEIMTATAAFMGATAIALAVGWIRERKIATMPLVSAAFVLVFGGLTLALDDALFIKIKPTIVYLLFAAVLGVSLLLGRRVLQRLLGTMLALTDEGWRRLSVRWTVFFVVMAAINEVAWRTLSTDMWVNVKVFGFLPLTIAFSMAQLPLIRRHQPED